MLKKALGITCVSHILFQGIFIKYHKEQWFFFTWSTLFFLETAAPRMKPPLKEAITGYMSVEELFLVSQQPNCVWHQSAGRIKGCSKRRGRTSITWKEKTWSCLMQRVPEPCKADVSLALVWITQQVLQGFYKWKNPSLRWLWSC